MIAIILIDIDQWDHERPFIGNTLTWLPETWYAGKLRHFNFIWSIFEHGMNPLHHRWYLDTLRPRQSGRHFCRRHIQMHFLEWKSLNVDNRFLNQWWSSLLTHICRGACHDWMYVSNGNISSIEELGVSEHRFFITWFHDKCFTEVSS